MNNKIEMKMKKNQLTMLVLFATMLGFTACSDDDKVSISTVGITTTVDTTIEGLQLTGGTYTFENVNTSVKTDITYPAQSIELADGLYNVTFIGNLLTEWNSGGSRCTGSTTECGRIWRVVQAGTEGSCTQYR